MSRDTNLNLLKAKLAVLPKKPGVYRFFDKNSKLLYIGKAKNLSARVNSYFKKSTSLSPAKTNMVAAINDINYTVVTNENEALILEAQTIKKYQPPYNVDLKDDKNWLYVGITSGAWPQIITLRQPEKFLKTKRLVKIYGPFTSAKTLHYNLKFLKKLFPFYNEQGAFIELNKKPRSAYHLGRYLDRPTVSQKIWQNASTSAAAILSGKINKLTQKIKKDLTSSIKKQNFERAAELRDQLENLQQFTGKQNVSTLTKENVDYWHYAQKNASYLFTVLKVREGRLLISSDFKSDKLNKLTLAEALENFLEFYYGFNNDVPDKIIIPELTTQTIELPEKVKLISPKTPKQKKLLNLAKLNAETKINSQAHPTNNFPALNELKKQLNLPNTPRRLEAYDISNIQGNFAVGSMVVFTNGLPDKKEYRHFKIKTVKGINDFLMIKEIVSRRAKRADWTEPDLLIIDGGMLQLNQALLALNTANKTWPIISLAKKREEIYLPHKIHPLIIPIDSPSSLLLQAARDEAHRFAINYYRKLHKKEIKK